MPIALPKRPKPNISIPHSATLVDDVTGEPRLRVGDSPNGPETLTVTPPEQMPASGETTIVPPKGARVPFDALTFSKAVRMAARRYAQQIGGTSATASGQATNAAPDGREVKVEGGKPYKWDGFQWVQREWRGSVPSAAGGGVALIGGSSSISPELRRRRALFDASRNTADQEQVAQINQTQAQENQTYGQYGVVGPQQHRLKAGQRASNNPFLQDTASTAEDLLGDQYEEEDLLKAESDAAQPRIGGSSSNNGGGSGASAGRSRSSGGGGRGSSRGGGSGSTSNNKIQVVDPRTGETHYAKDRLDADSLAAEFAGKEQYLDPFSSTGEPEYLTPAEKAVRDDLDKEKLQRMGNQRKGQQDQWGALSEGELLGLVEDEKLPPGDVAKVLSRRKGIPLSQAQLLVSGHVKPAKSQLNVFKDDDLISLLSGGAPDDDVLAAAYDKGDIEEEEVIAELRRRRYPEAYIQGALEQGDEADALYKRLHTDPWEAGSAP